MNSPRFKEPEENDLTEVRDSENNSTNSNSVNETDQSEESAASMTESSEKGIEESDHKNISPDNIATNNYQKSKLEMPLDRKVIIACFSLK